MPSITRLTLAVPAVAAALVMPALADAHADARAGHCSAGHHRVVTIHHHKRHIACVKIKSHQGTTAPVTTPVTTPTAPTANPVTPTPAPTTPTPTPTTPTTTTPSAPITTTAPPTTTDPVDGPPTGPPAFGPPSTDPPSGPSSDAVGASHRHNLASNALTHAASYVGVGYSAQVACDGALSAFDFNTPTGTSHDPGWIDLSPVAVPAAGLSSQYVAAREFLYSYAQEKWFSITNWQIQVVTPQNPNIITVGDTDGSPFRFNGELGNVGWSYIDTQYYWWNGSGWVGGGYAGTSQYLQSYSVSSRASSAYCDLT